LAERGKRIIHGAMSDEPIKASEFAEQLLILNQQLANLRASVNVLRVLEAKKLSPDDVRQGLEALVQLENIQLHADPSQKVLKESAELIDALKQWKKMGEPHGKA
jgi:hypothetical protein